MEYVIQFSNGYYLAVTGELTLNLEEALRFGTRHQASRHCCENDCEDGEIVMIGRFYDDEAPGW